MIRSIPQDAWNLWTIQFCPDLSQNRLLGHPITKSGSEEDPSDPMQHKIMGGGDAAVGEYPWTVWIGYYKKGRLLNACGGTLITRKHVATAAHCFWVNRRRRCGIAMEDFFEQNCTGYKDIALLELRHSIPTELHHICLPHLHNIDHLDQKTASLRVAGWGLDPFHQTDGIGLVPRLQKLDVGRQRQWSNHIRRRPILSAWVTLARKKLRGYGYGSPARGPDPYRHRIFHLDDRQLYWNDGRG
ncbi:unnamed protein product [Nippostrongylus brasiliensis]|uniref:Peptidase S1 domain-containing protein n=1 Tax=Nippostrongylus brasiliensis TaxID=27835 RepID=A0A0N4XX40_NIPBR|nr:unnamed protein product [Nippostrongylus brasiliensis]